MKHILIGHSYWGRGGAEIAAMWLLQSLIDEYRIDVITRGGWNLEELNYAAGTNVSESAIHVIYAPFSNNRIAGAIWLSVFERYCRHIAGQYDLCITASRVIDWGVPAIHFFSDALWNLPLQIKFKSAEISARMGILRSSYWWFADNLRGESGRSPVKNDLFIANSNWTAKLSKEYCSSEIVVIHPPVTQSFKNSLPWDNRENSFVCLGRISPEKEIEQLIFILDAVHQIDPSVRLHLVGAFQDDTYSINIFKLCHDRSDWIVIHDALYGKDKEVLLGRCKYGISACKVEAYGIATAEMVQAGMLPFVPKEGAQVELVNDEALIYGSNQEAIEKIVAVLRSNERQINLISKLGEVSIVSSPELFCKQVRSVVALSCFREGRGG